MPCLYVAYLRDSRLLRALARVLELPAVACTTAFTYLHRIRLLQHEIQLTGQGLVTACIYVAAKVEEVQISANQLINSARILSLPAQSSLLQSLAPLPAHLVSQQQQQQQQQEQQLTRQVSVPGQQQQAQHRQHKKEEGNSRVDNLKPIAAIVEQDHQQQQQQQQRGYVSLHQQQQPKPAADRRLERQHQHSPGHSSLQQQHQQHQPLATQSDAAEHKHHNRQHQQQQAYPQQQQQQEAATAAVAQPCLNSAAGNSNQLQQQFPQTELPTSAVVVGDEYYQAKDALFTAEQIVLRLINFKLEAPQPHKHLLNFCKLLGVSQVIAAAAVCLLNDVIAYTSLSVRTDPAVLAAAVLECCCECLCRTAGTLNHRHQQQQQQEGLQQPVQPADLLPGSSLGSVRGVCTTSDKPHGEINADVAAGYAADSSEFHQKPQLVRDVHLESVPQVVYHQKQDVCDHQSRDDVSLQQQPPQQQQEARNSSPGSTGRGRAHRDWELYGHQSRQQQRRHHGQGSGSSRSINASMPAAALDGSWVELVGLNRVQVAELSQQLRQLLTSEQQRHE